jgi:hypothetical protein
LQARGEQERHLVAVAREEEPACDGAEHEARGERRTDEGECMRALLGLDAIGYVGLRDGDISAGDPLDDARDEDPEERRRESEPSPPDRRADLRDDEDAFTSDAIAHMAPERTCQKLAECKNGEELADRNRRCTEMLDVIRQDRNQNTEPENVDERDA